MRTVAWKDDQPLFAAHFYAWEKTWQEQLSRREMAMGFHVAGFLNLELGEGWDRGQIVVVSLCLALADGVWLDDGDLVGGRSLQLPDRDDLNELWVGLEPVRRESVADTVSCPEGVTRNVEFWWQGWSLAWRSDGAGQSFVPLLLLRNCGSVWCHSPTWLPPVLRPAAHPAWRLRLHAVEDRLALASDCASLARLRRLWLALSGQPPHLLYLECQAAFEFGADYDAVRPVRWFGPLEQAVRVLAGGGCVEEGQGWVLSDLGNGIFMVSMKMLGLKPGERLVLEVRGGEIVDKGDLRVGALSRLPRMLRMALPGVSLRELPGLKGGVVLESYLKGARGMNVLPRKFSVCIALRSIAYGS